MKKFLNNKKGFTLTELIVVIVIIGILAAVLIPTLTGYIKKAKYSAAEQEAISYSTAFQTWEIETAGKKQDLSSFRNYCVELELVSLDTVEEVILYAELTSKMYVIKASNGLYVQYVNGEYTVLETMPELTAKDSESFYHLVIKNNIADVNEGIKGVAQIKVGELSAEGSASVEVQIIDKDEKTVEVFAAVYEVIDLIIAAGGKNASITPVIDDLEASEYFELLNISSDRLDENGEFYVELEASNLRTLANYIAAAITYEDGKDYSVEANMDEWNTNATNLIETNLENAPALSELLNKNTIKIIANIEPDGVTPYQVVYEFTFTE